MGTAPGFGLIRGYDMLRLTPILLLAGLASCAQISGFVDTSISAIKAANDKTATTLIQANCGMSVGAYWRVLNDQKRAAVNILCGGNGVLPTVKTIIVPILPQGSRIIGR